MHCGGRPEKLVTVIEIWNATLSAFGMFQKSVHSEPRYATGGEESVPRIRSGLSSKKKDTVRILIIDTTLLPAARKTHSVETAGIWSSIYKNAVHGVVPRKLLT
jgi:hypothetical protein